MAEETAEEPMKAVFALSVISGVNVRADREIRALKEAGWEIETVRSDWLVPPKGFVQRVAAYRAVSKALIDEIVNMAPDLIIVHDIYMLQPGVVAAKRLRVPVLYDTHEHWPSLIAKKSLLESLAARAVERWYRADHVLAVSEPVARRFPRATVFYNARYADEIRLADRDTSRKELGYEPGDIVVGYVGSKAHLQGFSKLLNHFAANMHVLLVLRSTGGNVDLSGKKVVYDYDVPPTELGKYYAAMDVGLVVHPNTLNGRLALPNKLFEYMAYGVPVIAPDFAKETARVIRETGCGTVFPGTIDIPALRTMGDAGRKAFLETYCWDKQAVKFVEICESFT